MSPSTMIGYSVGGVVFAAALYLRWRRMSRARPLKIERMWIRPVIMVAVCVLVLAQYPPRLTDLPWLVLALGLGALVGWQRGRFVRIDIHPETHEINQQASPAAMLFLVGIVVLRIVLRNEAMAAWHVSVALITDLSMVFVVGLLGVQQLEMWLRARTLLAQARAGKQA